MKKEKRVCKLCGKNSNGLVYCNECRPIATRLAEEERIRNGEKYTDSLEDTLGFCKRIGLTYGEYQKLLSLKKAEEDEKK